MPAKNQVKVKMAAKPAATNSMTKCTEAESDGLGDGGNSHSPALTLQAKLRAIVASECLYTKNYESIISSIVSITKAFNALSEEWLSIIDNIENNEYTHIEYFEAYCRKLEEIRDIYKLELENGPADTVNLAHDIEKMPLIDKSCKEAFEASLKSFFKRQGLASPQMNRLCEAAVRQHFNDLGEYHSLPEELPKKIKVKGRVRFLQIDGSSFPSYADREDKEENVLTFYKKWWKPYADAGLLFRPTLAKYDSKIVQGMFGHCQRHPEDGRASDILPPTQKEYIDERIRNSGLSENEIMKLGQALLSRNRPERRRI